MIKAALIMTVIGHILCGICDCLLSYSKKGRLDLKDIKDQDKFVSVHCSILTVRKQPLIYQLSALKTCDEAVPFSLSRGGSVSFCSTDKNAH